MAVQIGAPDAESVQEQVIAVARLLEDIAHTCVVLRAACQEQAQILRTVSRDAQALAHVQRAEAALATRQLYAYHTGATQQRPHASTGDGC
ncbi:MAG TPA: hypothetical protein VHB98_05035 [Chloroflexota bacterium]|jgi:hypothetical protein|nr:hypothetical protein [Chloroflexota bacterium]